MRILVIQGHPDGRGGHYCHGLADAYAAGAEAAGHEVRRIDVGRIDVMPLRSAEDWSRGTPPDYAIAAQGHVLWAEHIVLVFPVWLGGMPGHLKAWFETVFREGFAMEIREAGWVRKLKGKSARIVLTMGAPAMFYRWVFGQPGSRLLRRAILGFSGISPIRQSLIGRVDAMSPEAREEWITHMGELGRKGG